MGVNIRQIGELSRREQQQFRDYVNYTLRKILDRRRKLRKSQNDVDKQEPLW